MSRCEDQRMRHVAPDTTGSHGHSPWVLVRRESVETKDALEFEEGNMGIPGGVKVSQVKLSKSSKKEKRRRWESFYSWQVTSSWLKTGVSSDWCHSVCNKECVLVMILYSMQTTPVIMFHNQPGGWGRKRAFYVRLHNCDRSHLCFQLVKQALVWISHSVFHTRLCLDLKQVALGRQSVLWLEPFKGSLFDIKTKLLVVASTYSPLQGHILYSLLPPLASPHSAWLSVPAAGPLHSCSLHLQGSSFLLLLSLSLNAVLSLAPLSPWGASLLFSFMEHRSLLHGICDDVLWPMSTRVVCCLSTPPPTVLTGRDTFMCLLPGTGLGMQQTLGKPLLNAWYNPLTDSGA